MKEDEVNEDEIKEDEIKEENQNNEKPQDIIVSIKDDNSRSSSDGEDDDSDSQIKILYEEQKTEIKEEEVAQHEAINGEVKIKESPNLDSSKIQVSWT